MKEKVFLLVGYRPTLVAKTVYKVFYLSCWFRSVTKLPIILKGILTAEDSRLAVQHGVDGIIVSAHGGRRLNTVPTTVRLSMTYACMIVYLFDCTVSIDRVSV